ncbi:RNA-binding ASCH domain protein [Klebsormidium nitens]|uniref:RNA-binding ASCH domain protein n=1 Tax=Klebsormidium nitens TaxID=105231 RepID=A0A1Y1HVJ8_KLENI|nr:RNA-binding ASCH domain protein [Klebsormidium nitens]|eukprot:GAQ82654.1 RNA-binding ASCH domain protein [Klebsormidium nitens]
METNANHSHAQPVPTQESTTLDALDPAELQLVEVGLRNALAALQTGGTNAAVLSTRICQQLLEEEPNQNEASAANATPGHSQSGVLSRPLVRHVAWALLQWHKAGRFPVELPPIEGLQEDRSWEGELDGWTRKIETALGALLEVRKAALSLHVQEPWFSHLKSGAKSVEGRCAKEAYTRLEVGSILLVNDSLLLQVKASVNYDSFSSLLAQEGLQRVLPGCASHVDGCTVYRAFYTEEQERAAGVVAIHVEPCPEDTQPVHRIMTLLQELGPRPLFLLLRMRRTAGSIDDLLAPSRATMLAAFDALNDPKNRLTVGARALTKHAHRCSHNWWGVPTGSEQAKNEHARAVVLRILDGAVWQNAHLLPHDVAVFEARVAEGYGARWSADGTQFRGFLEPQMEGGHQRGWRH